VSLDVLAVVGELKTLIKADTDLRVYGYEPAIIDPPCVVVMQPESVTPALQIDGWDYDMPLRVVVGANDDMRGQAALDNLVATVIGRVRGNHDFGAVMVVNVTDFGRTALGDAPGPNPLAGYGATINVRVLA
jgi:hypothetical protein